MSGERLYGELHRPQFHRRGEAELASAVSSSARSRLRPAPRVPSRDKGSRPHCEPETVSAPGS